MTPYLDGRDDSLIFLRAPATCRGLTCAWSDVCRRGRSRSYSCWGSEQRWSPLTSDGRRRSAIDLLSASSSGLTGVRGSTLFTWSNPDAPRSFPATHQAREQRLPWTSGPRVVGASAGQSHVCLLRGNGRVGCLGDNSRGQLGGQAVSSPGSVADLGVQDVTDISSGPSHTCLLTRTGAVSCWGTYGPRLSVPPLRVPTPVVNLCRARQIVAFGLDDEGSIAGSNCALCEDGTVQCWGANEVRQLGTESDVGRIDARPVPGVRDVTELTAGTLFVCALTRDDQVFDLPVWGSGSMVRASVPSPR
jgi:hypothetical protein